MIVKGAVCYCSQTFLSRSGYKTILDSALLWRYRMQSSSFMESSNGLSAVSAEHSCSLCVTKARSNSSLCSVSPPAAHICSREHRLRAVRSLQQQQVQLLDADPLCSIETWGSVPHWVIYSPFIATSRKLKPVGKVGRN